MKKAIFPISADPLTYGHISIIKKAVALCEEKLFVVILDNFDKIHLFSLADRARLARETLETYCHHPLPGEESAASTTDLELLEKIEVIPWKGMLHHIMLEKSVFNIIRGIRSGADVAYEHSISKGYYAQFNKKTSFGNSDFSLLESNDAIKVNFIYLLSHDSYQDISSRLVKNIVSHGGDVSTFVPPAIKQQLELQLLRQYKIIVTGSVGSGKSTIIPKLISALQENSTEAHNINTDEIVSKIYEKLAAGNFQALSEKLSAHFKLPAPITKQKISAMIFKTKNKQAHEDLKFLENVLAPYIHSAYRQSLANKHGVIFIEAPQATEYGFIHEGNGFVLFIQCHADERRRRLKKYRKISSEEINNRMELSTSQEEKQSKAEAAIKELHFGHLLMYDNSHPDDFTAIKEIGQKIVSIYSHHISKLVKTKN